MASRTRGRVLSLACGFLAASLAAASSAQSAGAPATRRVQLKIAQPAPLIIDKPMAPGGTVVLDINVGDVKILPSKDNHVRLEIDPKAFYDADTVAGWVHRFEVAANRASIDLQMPKSNHGHSSPEVTLYVPANGDLELSLGIGDLNVNGIRGDKDLHVGVGDLTVGFDSDSEYGHVVLSTRIGDVSDPLNPGGQHGFLGKDDEFNGKGHYHLRATVGVGDLSLVPHDHS
ncbi:MAG: hypothetical protein WA414_10220 [Acidobacteriaceae bacterium]